MTKFVRFVFAVSVAITFQFTASAQSVGINTTGAVADPSAMLDVTSTTKGVLIPRMDKTQKTSIATPATGLLVYQTGPDSLGFHYYDGAGWIWLSGTSDSTAWKITGNSNITSSSFLGTTNDTALRFRVKNIPSGIVDSASSNTALGYKNLNSITTGVGNNIFGYMAGKSLSTGAYNTAIGRDALSRTGVSAGNIAMGDSAMSQAASSFNNIAIGLNALKKFNGGGGYTNNVAIGTQSQEDTTAAGLSYYNTSVGSFSLQYLHQGTYNTGLGLSALRNADTSYYNTAVGADAMYFHKTSGNSNVAIGAFANRGDSTGFWNTAVGSEAMDRFGADGTARGSGFSNVAVGFRALRQLREGFENTALGVGALELDSSGNYNTAVGRYSSFLNKRGDYNVSMGYQSANNADTASAVVAIGSLALLNNRSDSNVAVGYRAGRSLGSNGAWAPTEATMIGNWAGDAAFVSSKNTAVGFRALTQRNAAGGGSDYTGGGRNTAIGDSAMAWSVGISNVAVGAQALPNAGTLIFQNVAIGDSALGGAKLVSDNVAVGFHSLKSLNYGSAVNNGNTATGAYSGRNMTTGYWNTANGYFALDSTVNGAGNTAVGTSSFRSNVAGFDNVGVGINSGYYVTTSNNTFLGAYAGQGAPGGVTTGGANTGVGYYALSNIQSGNSNTAVGRTALFSDTSGDANVAIGRDAMRNSVASDFNTAVGYNSLYFHKRTGFTYNTAVGASALEQDTSGFQNTGVGVSAFRQNRTGFYNTGMGINAGYHQKESYNTHIGAYAGVGERTPGSDYAADTSNYNSSLGAFAMYRIADGSNNVAMGYSAMRNDSSGNLNTAVGNGALYSNVESHTNQAFGWNALYSYVGTSDGWNNAFGDRAAESLQTGTQNVAMGSWSMLGHTSGSLNTVIGNWAMGNGGTTGTSNTALGAQSLWRTNADGNVGIGTYAGQTNTTGTNNTFLGTFADVTTSGLTNATAIGYNARVAASNSLVLGASGTNVGINETSPNARLHIVRSGTSGGSFHASSSAIIEDNATSYLQFSNPNGNETGLLSGNVVTTIRSGMIFRADSSIQLRSGGNTTAMAISNTQDVGIGTTAPAARLDVNGDFVLGTNGTVLTQLIKETITGVTIPSVAVNSSTTSIDYAVPNAQLGATVYVSPSSALPGGVFIAAARVISVGNVRVYYGNVGAGASTATAGYSLYITVIN